MTDEEFEEKLPEILDDAVKQVANVSASSNGMHSVHSVYVAEGILMAAKAFVLAMKRVDDRGSAS